MSKFFTPLRQAALFFINTDPSMILNELLVEKELKEFILDLNRIEQLFKKGVDSNDTRLELIGGGYSACTIDLKSARGIPTDRITLFYNGDFYETFFLRINKNSFIIDADTIKISTGLTQQEINCWGDSSEPFDLRDRWGDDITGLTDDNLSKLAGRLTPLFVEYIQANILR